MKLLRRLVVAPLALCASVLVPSIGQAGDTVHVLVIKEQGVGSAAQGQPFVDKLVAAAARKAGWASAKGSYKTTRKAAVAYIQDNDPHFGIMSLSSFLALRGKYGLEVIGSVNVARGGGEQYHLISKRGASAGGCRGKALASNHTRDAKFVERVVFGGKMALSDFKLMPTTRPVQTLQKVIRGDAECALIDDAQYAELAHVEGGNTVQSVWKSDKLPPMVVVAFPSAPAAEKRGFASKLDSICEGDGKATCQEAGIKAMKPASAETYAPAVNAYDK